jgi:hypothetical protein
MLKLRRIERRGGINHRLIRSKVNVVIKQKNKMKKRMLIKNKELIG